METISLSGIVARRTSSWDGESKAGYGEAVSLTLEQALTADLMLLAGAGTLALVAPAGAAFADLEAAIERLDAERVSLVELVFDAFTDGRGFTNAVRLRRDAGFAGELRGSGPLVPDQALYLARSGFDTLAVSREGRKQAFLDALARYKVFYQTAADREVPVPHQRGDETPQRIAS